MQNKCYVDLRMISEYRFIRYRIASVRKDQYFTYQLFLLYEFDVGQDFSGELNGLIEAVLSSVRDVDQLQHFRL